MTGRLRSLLPLAALGLACVEAPNERRRIDGGALQALLESAGPEVTRYGTLDGAGALGEVVAARLAPDGRFVAVLDNAEPYVRVFRDGDSVLTFLARGDGPAEAVDPTSLATNGREIAVLGGSRLSVFDPAGGLLGVNVIDGIVPETVGWGCGRWIVYGAGVGGGREAGWLHTLVPGDGGIARTSVLFRDTIQADRIWRRTQGPLSSVNAVIFYHEKGEPPHLREQPCDGTDGRALSGNVRPDNQEATTRRAGAGRVSTLRIGMPLHVGALATGELAVEAAWRVGYDSTWFRIVDPSGTSELSLPGRLKIHDYHPGAGVLLSTDVPFPRLIRVDHAAFERVLYGDANSG